MPIKYCEGRSAGLACSTEAIRRRGACRPRARSPRGFQDRPSCVNDDPCGVRWPTAHDLERRHRSASHASRTPYVQLRGDSPLRRAPGFHPHAGQRRGLVPFVGSPVPKASSVLVRSVRYGGPTATQRQAPKDPSGSPTKATTSRPEWRARIPMGSRVDALHLRVSRHRQAGGSFSFTRPRASRHGDKGC